MNDKDKEAFYNWYSEKVALNHDSKSDAAKSAWQAACEYKEAEIKAYVNHLKDFDDEIGRLQTENKKLREALEFYAQPWERGELDGELLIRKLGSYDNFKEVHSIAREALKEMEK